MILLLDSISNSFLILILLEFFDFDFSFSNNTDSHISRLSPNFIFQAFERREKHS